MSYNYLTRGGGGGPDENQIGYSVPVNGSYSLVGTPGPVGAFSSGGASAVATSEPVSCQNHFSPIQYNNNGLVGTNNYVGQFSYSFDQSIHSDEYNHPL